MKWNFHKKDDNSDIGYTLEVDVRYPMQLQRQNNDLMFLPKRMNI